MGHELQSFFSCIFKQRSVPLRAVRIELGACGAQGLPAYCTGLTRLIFVVRGAIQRDHLGNRPLLALSPFSGFRCVFHG